MKALKLIFATLLITHSPQITGQSLGKAIVSQGNFYINKGDTLAIYGKHPLYQEYLVNYGDKYRTLPVNRMKIIAEPSEFWAFQWYKYAGYDYHKYPSIYSFKQSHNDRLLQYLADLESNNTYYFDPFVEDYLHQLCLHIYPEPVDVGKRMVYIQPKLVNKGDITMRPLANGVILIGVDYLSKIKNEPELIGTLAVNIAHIVLLHPVNLVNKSYPNYNWEDQLFSPEYTTKQKTVANLILNKFQHSKIGKDSSVICTQQHQYLDILSGIIGYVAWQKYYSNAFEEANVLADKLIQNKLANDDIYLLKAKILRKGQSNFENNIAAINILATAQKTPVHNYADIYLEKGLLQYRLNRFSEAELSFKKYLEFLEESKADGQKLKWCREMIIRCQR